MSLVTINGASSVIVDIREGIATLTLNRPDQGNAIDFAMARSILEAAIRCDENPAIRCVVLTAAGKLFCAGGDLGLFASAAGDISAVLTELAETLHAALIRLARMSKPILILVNGPAAGAGFSLALSGDVVLMARSAHFTAAYGELGLTPDGGMSWLLPRLVGLRKAQEIILTNRRVSAEEAVAIGLVTDISEDADLMKFGQNTALRLAEMSMPAAGLIRNLLQKSYSTDFDEQLDREVQAMNEVSATAGFISGLAAYFQKRKT